MSNFFLSIVTMSDNLLTICCAVNGIIEVHTEDDNQEVYFRLEMDSKLQALKTLLLKRVKEALTSCDNEEDREVYSDVSDNFAAFLDYKLKTAKKQTK